MQKVISCSASEVETKTEKDLKNGWRVVSMIAENVSTSASVSTGSSFSFEKESTKKGLIVFLLEKSDV